MAAAAVCSRESMIAVQPLICGSGEARSMLLHNARFSRRFLDFGFCAAASDSSDSKMRIAATPLIMPPLAIDDISTFPTLKSGNAVASKRTLHALIWQLGTENCFR